MGCGQPSSRASSVSPPGFGGQCGSGHCRHRSPKLLYGKFRPKFRPPLDRLSSHAKKARSYRRLFFCGFCSGQECHLKLSNGPVVVLEWFQTVFLWFGCGFKLLFCGSGVVSNWCLWFWRGFKLVSCGYGVVSNWLFMVRTGSACQEMGQNGLCVLNLDLKRLNLVKKTATPMSSGTKWFLHATRAHTLKLCEPNRNFIMPSISGPRTSATCRAADGQSLAAVGVCPV